ncbi:MAG: Smr/MutS family protein [Planctomycetota bacterium]|jgi:DNA mismatch repair protein MutS2
MPGRPWTEEGSGRRRLDLHGLYREEAIRRLRQTVDACREHGVPRLRVVHGKGTGVLRDAVRAFLDGYPGVEDFAYARPRHGGEGATEVRIGR